MPVFTAPGDGRKWHGMGYLFGPRTKQTWDEEEVLKMKAAVDADMEACGCNPREFAPQHYTGHYTIDGDKFYGYTYQCRSLSRWYNPETSQMEGHAHCTCDGCF